jgi:hypothetical protein
MKNTNWSSPKTNMLAGLLSLRSALAAGENAELIRMYNKDCNYPIKKKEDPKKVDFRQYSFSIGYPSTYNQVLNTGVYNIELTLNYKSCYGTQEAVDHYYKTGELSADNVKNMGRNHLVKVDDLISYYSNQPDAWSRTRATELTLQYRTPDMRDTSAWFDFFIKEHGNEWSIVEFNHKLWVVNLLNKKDLKAKQPLIVSILNVLIKLLVVVMKYTPRKDVLNMKEYKNITYRVGGIVNGFSVQFQLPKKFSFK